MKITFNAGEVDKLLNKEGIKAINSVLPKVKGFIENLTPEDTKTLLGSYKIKQATDEGNKIVGSVFTEVPYAIFVEYGVAGKAYKYNKPKGTIFNVGVGNRTFTRAIDNNAKTIRDLLQASL